MKKSKSIVSTARLAGILYLIMAPLGFFGIMYIPSTLIVAGDAATTVNNILSDELLFRMSILSAIFAQIIQIILVLVLYKLLKPVSKSYATLMVVFILVAVPIAILNELNNFAVLQLLDFAEYFPLISVDGVNSQIMFFLDLHESGIIIAQIFWGLWLFPMGYLVYKSGYIPKVIGVLLIIGGFGYVLDSLTLILYPNFGVTFSEFTFLGEIVLPLWLLIKGVNVETYNKLVYEGF